MPSLSGVIETALCVEDIDRAARFYEEVLSLRRIEGDDRFRAYSVAEHDVLLLFKSGATKEPLQLPGGIIPPHDGSGQNHLAFSIAQAELTAWEDHLKQNDVAIESRVHWPRGGVSIFFRDIDNNLLEIATPGIWSIY